jgi:hypothetical protein
VTLRRIQEFVPLLRGDRRRALEDAPDAVSDQGPRGERLDVDVGGFGLGGLRQEREDPSLRPFAMAWALTSRSPISSPACRRQRTSGVNAGASDANASATELPE